MKKFLSLVLALVMTMSLVTVSAGAKDFSDSSKIAYKEAVDVMSAVKVIDGYTDGSFNPSTTLTRGAAAKIICNLILGPTTAGALVADAAPYKDVPTNHTFAGYIAYCQKAGIISGYADGTFKPAASLTGYAFMKMLLGALGYDATREGYTGGNWSINVAKQALNIGLADGLDGNFNGVKAVTREEACLYAFNMIQADIVEYEKNSTISVGNITVTDKSAAKSKRWGSSAINDGNIDGKKGDGYVQFAEEYFNKLVKSETSDDMGRPATKWVNKGDKIGTYADKAAQTYDKNVKLGTIYSDLGMTQKDEHATVIVNGIEATNVVVSKNNDRKISSSVANDELVGDGSIVEVYYDDDNNHVTIVVADVYVGEITSKETKAADPYVVVGLKGQMKKNDLTNYSYTGNKTHFECDTSAFAEDDIVLFTYSQKEDSIQTVVKAESAEGVVSSYTAGKKLTLADKEYKYAKNINFDFGTESDMSTKNNYTIYTDANGLVIYVTESEFKPTDYAFVLYVTSSSGVGFDKDQAKLVLADGTLKTVDTDDDYTNYAGTIVTYRENADKEYVLRKAPNSTFNGTTLTINDTTSAIATSGVLSGGVVPTATRPSTPGTSFYMQNGNAAVYPGNSTVVYANSETVFVIAESNAAGKTTYTAYTGIKNAPSIDPNSSATADMVYYVRGNNLLGFVFIDATGCDVTNGKRDITFLAAKNGMSKMVTDADNNQYYEYNAVVDGKITTVKVDRYATGIAVNNDSRNFVYENVKYNNKGTIITAGSTVSTDYDVVENYTTGIWKLNGEYTIGLDSTTTASASTRYTVATDAQMYLIDTDGVITKVTDVKDFVSDSSAKVIALMDKRDGDIAFLFVQEIDNGKKDDATVVVPTTPISGLSLAANAGSAVYATINGVTENETYTLTLSMVVNGVEKTIETKTVKAAADGNLDVTFGNVAAAGVMYTVTCNGVTRTAMGA